MRALVLCAGFGTRLGPLCDERPKPLLQVGGRAIVEHILLRLGAHGFRDVAVNLHYRAEDFPALLGDGSRFGVRLRYLHEAAPLGTAGTTRGVLAESEEDLLVHYGDILTDHDLGQLAAEHRRHGAWATALLHQREGSNSRARLDERGRVTAFQERPAPGEVAVGAPWVFSGICMLSAAAQLAFSDAPTLDLPRDVFPALVRTRKLYGQPLAGYRCAVDSPDRLEAVRAAVASGAFKSLRHEGGV